jgi:hypothetical protein
VIAAQLFDSVSELFEMLKDTDLAAVSLRMRAHNKQRVLGSRTCSRVRAHARTHTHARTHAHMHTHAEAHSQWNFIENHIRIYKKESERKSALQFRVHRSRWW